LDRLVQKAVAQVLSPIFEEQFPDNSFESPSYDAFKADERLNMVIRFFMYDIK